MELRSIQSPLLSSIPTTKTLCYNNQLSSSSSSSISFGSKRTVQSNVVKHRSLQFDVRASATISVQPAETKSKDGEKDGNVIFVAGATGKVGSRTVRELLKLGFNVRAGVRSIQKAESLVKSVEQMKLDEALSDGSQPIEKLQLVECDLEKPEQIKGALGSASIVICCIGASEKEIFDVTGPYRIDFLATKNLIDAAAAAKAKQFILVTSLGTNKFGFPAAVLNLFWGVLCWKRKAEEALLASGIPYTIVRPGGMERPTDTFKETHNLTLAMEDTLFGGLVSNLQVAELLAFMAKNPTLSYCKVVEVVAETTAPLTPMGDLLTKIPPKRVVPSPPKEPETPKEPQAPKEPEASKEPEPVSKTESIAAETQSETKPASTRPLSPYTMYEGLKPPASPIPTAPGGSKVVVEAGSAPKEPEASKEPEPVFKTESVATETQSETKPASTRPLSPYTMYEGLKPPASPIPTAPGSSKVVVEAVSAPPTDSELSIKSETTAITSEPAPEAAVSETTRPLSPYTAYDNLKPPTSPSPSTPSVSPPPPVSVDNGSPITSAPENPTVKPRPLSPYHMYENLKPPTSPIPSTP
uniref:protein TIC 62, chloroplastic n=1 Tax=Erigeron canadensis TaxID=72917 RepID=UPI001CB8DC75|nr:protein TIC 62, chloroplastic [Erigeron canadensis]